MKTMQADDGGIFTTAKFREQFVVLKRPCRVACNEICKRAAIVEVGKSRSRGGYREALV